jgi:hypothetical protein
VVAGTVTVSASASDAIGVVGVQFRLDGANLGAEDMASPYAVDWNSLGVVNGTYELAAVARDAAGNVATAAPVNVTVNNDTTPPVVLAITPAASAIDVSRTTTVTARFDEALNPATLTSTTFVLRNPAGTAVAATLGYDPATFTAVLTPTTALANGTRYTATVAGGTVDPRIKDLAGNPLAVSGAWSFTVIPADTQGPAVTLTAPSDGAVINGTVTLSANATDSSGVAGVRFRLNGANFGAEDTVAPYSINWDTVASANGVYQVTALARDSVGNTRISLPINVTVDNDKTPPVVVAFTPPAGATDVPLTTTLRVQFNEAMAPTTISGTTFVLRNAAGSTVARSVGYDPTTFTAIITPTSALASSARFTMTVVGGTSGTRVRDLAGNALATSAVWSFTTGLPPANCPCSIWGPTATPSTASTNDRNPVEVGVKFRTDRDGYITGIRFYKGALNTGTHIGNLWTSSGQLLASAPFANETASGWQQVNFATPVAVTANTTYVASYFTSSGYFSSSSRFFATRGVNNPPLFALANGVDGGNGVYRYGATSGFPTLTNSSTNYWVDVVFVLN